VAADVLLNEMDAVLAERLQLPTRPQQRLLETLQFPLVEFPVPLHS
jgi:hypothetical protein